MDTLFIIQSSTSVKNSVTNEPEETWSDFKTLWGKELGPASKEQIDARQTVALATARLMIRRDATIIEKMRVKKGNVYFYISGIEDFGRQGYMILTAEKRDNHG